MTIHFSVPESVEAHLKAELGGNINETAKQALAVELYREGKISLGLLAEMLGMGVIEADAWLAERGVALNYSAEDFDADRERLAEIFPDLQ